MIEWLKTRYLKNYVPEWKPVIFRSRSPNFENTTQPCFESKLEVQETWANKVKWLTVAKDLVATLVGITVLWNFFSQWF